MQPPLTTQELYAVLDVEHAKGRILDGINAALEACSRHPDLDGVPGLLDLLHTFARALTEECTSTAVRVILDQYAPHLAEITQPQLPYPRLFARAQEQDQ